MLGYRAESAQAAPRPARPASVRAGRLASTQRAARRPWRRCSRSQRPQTAVFAASDAMAVRRAEKAAEGSPAKRVPQRTSLSSASIRHPAREPPHPRLTTIRQGRAGDRRRSSGRSLVDMIENSEVLPHVRMLPVELVVRESCGAGQAAPRRRAARPGRKKEVDIEEARRSDCGFNENLFARRREMGSNASRSPKRRRRAIITALATLGLIAAGYARGDNGVAQEPRRHAPGQPVR